jgi:predicted glycosyltransferase involved in capsule biosynthesis
MSDQVSLVSRCMDRLSFLQKVLPSWLKQPYSEIIIIDWSSKTDNVLSIFETHADPRITVLKVNNQDYFINGAAWNVVVSYAAGPFINCVDCDIVLPDNFLNNIKLNQDCLYALSELEVGTYGTCIFSKNMWKQVDGYLECLDTWGTEDMDFYDRIRKAGFKHIKRPNCTLRHIEHDDKIRFKNYKSGLTTVKESNERNKMILQSIKQDTNYKNIMQPYQVEIFNHSGKIGEKLINGQS